MREHAAGRLAAASAIALVVLSGSGVTQAAWTGAVTASGASLTSGRVDLQVDGHDTVSGFAPFSLSGLEPGDSAAQLLTVGNAGTVPTAWSASLASTGSNGLDTALTARVTDATSTDGSGCGGTPLAGSSTLAAGATVTVCVEVSLAADAPASVAGSTAQVTLDVTGRTVRGAWPDTATAAGSGIATVALTPPAIRCGALGLGSVDIAWDPVPGATGYRVESTALPGGATQVGPSTTDFTLTGLAGTVAVRAEFGSATWLSAPSNQLGFDALSLATVAVCS